MAVQSLTILKHPIVVDKLVDYLKTEDVLKLSSVCSDLRPIYCSHINRASLTINNDVRYQSFVSFFHRYASMRLTDVAFDLDEATAANFKVDVTDLPVLSGVAWLMLSTDGANLTTTDGVVVALSKMFPKIETLGLWFDESDKISKFDIFPDVWQSLKHVLIIESSHSECISEACIVQQMLSCCRRLESLVVLSPCHWLRNQVITGNSAILESIRWLRLVSVQSNSDNVANMSLPNLELLSSLGNDVSLTKNLLNAATQSLRVLELIGTDEGDEQGFIHGVIHPDDADPGKQRFSKNIESLSLFFRREQSLNELLDIISQLWPRTKRLRVGLESGLDESDISKVCRLTHLRELEISDCDPEIALFIGFDMPMPDESVDVGPPRLVCKNIEISKGTSLLLSCGYFSKVKFVDCTIEFDLKSVVLSSALVELVFEGCSGVTDQGIGTCNELNTHCRVLFTQPRSDMDNFPRIRGPFIPKRYI